MRIELLAPAGPDTTAPVADLASPLGGSSIYPAVLNGQGYIEVTFNDSGDGIDAASIGGEEISISGTGVGTAVLDGTATLVSGTNYRYAFTGEFVEGTVDVTFVAGSFADLAATPNTNAAETESFTVATPPPAPAVQIMDDGDAGFSASGGWKDYSGAGYQGDLDFVAAGDGSGVANWTFTGLAAGNYEVSVVWLEHPNRTTDAPYRLFDDVTEVASVLLDQQSAPVADQVVDGGNFQIIAASVNISSGRLVVELSNAANGFVIADAVRIELLAPAGPDTTALEIVAANPAITSTESLSESSITEGSPINIYDRYKLAPAVLPYGGVDDATAIDTDGDGVADHTDLFPDDADFARVSDYVNFIIDYLVDDRVIFDEDWKELGNEADFIAELEAALELVLAAESSEDADEAAFLYLEALKMVDENLIPRTDGFHGGSLASDWLVVQEAQDIIHPDLLSLSEYLSLILE